ncbi:MAG: hypothetical protein Q4G49_04345 [Paracoccus sp. (in: a-proteobacteria)]|nr:hypothetical protein [Paracoccus sp. (in: a-proteobacteria)]
MNLISASTALAVPVASADPVAASFAAAQALFVHLQQGRRIDAALLREAMETAFGASDARSSMPALPH